jgi:ribosomal protein S18 acetylase RimI-like enzyme
MKQVAHIEVQVFGTSGELKHAKVCSDGSIWMKNSSKDMMQRHWFIINANNMDPSREDVEAIHGYLLLTDQADGSVYLDDLAVKPEFQGRGLGSELVRKAIAFTHPKLLFTKVDTGDARLRRFYGSAGFHPVAGSETSSPCYPDATVTRYERAS